jgi:N-dimethylarginine dimethylaminohydrolase
VLRARFPDAVVADPADAAVLGLNAVSDGLHVVLPAAATGLAARLAERGFTPVPVDLSELLKGGGGPKCCTLEVRP